MPRGTRWNDRLRARRRSILIGYNLPWLLWTGFALLRPELGMLARWECPVRALIGWCPGCGLTRGYAEFLRGEGLSSPWLAVVLAGFVANAIWSIALAWNLRADQGVGACQSP